MMNQQRSAWNFTERLAPCALARSSGNAAFSGVGFGLRHFVL
ncbi:MAG: hypothetical protein ACI3W5_04255 [Faecousia sp.]